MSTTTTTTKIEKLVNEENATPAAESKKSKEEPASRESKAKEFANKFLEQKERNVNGLLREALTENEQKRCAELGLIFGKPQTNTDESQLNTDGSKTKIGFDPGNLFPYNPDYFPQRLLLNLGICKIWSKHCQNATDHGGIVATGCYLKNVKDDYVQGPGHSIESGSKNFCIFEYFKAPEGVTTGIIFSSLKEQWRHVARSKGCYKDVSIKDTAKSKTFKLLQSSHIWGGSGKPGDCGHHSNCRLYIE